MGYVARIGRAGALAVALTFGFAEATTLGIAHAVPSDSTSAPTPAEDSSSPSQSPSSSTSEPPATPTTGGAGTTSASGSAAPPPPESTTASSTTVLDDGHGPVVTISSSGGAHASPDPHDDAEEANDRVDVARASSLQVAKNDSRLVPEATPATRRATSQAATVDEHEQATVRSMAAPADDEVSPAAVTPAMAMVVAAPQLHIAEVPERPRPLLIGAVAQLAGAVLDALMTPFGPGMPLQSPMVWTVLAFVRDEFKRILLPYAAPANMASSLVESPNLLVNPGAEAGDPSLSGYAAVTVPGWELTGTPTVIRYGTERRFPSPTASPGPVLPGFLAFPRSAGATLAQGAQFFGGGPVADSTLTQIVDLSAAHASIDAGVGVFTLAGDLGGFFIDPSRTKAEVDFLDGNGVKLGTGALQSVSAWDRLFATGFIHRQTSGALPVGTRSAKVVVSFDDRNPILGNYNNAYADNLSFTVNDPTLTPALLAPPVVHVGPLDHVFMVYLENKGVGQIVGSPNAPYLNLLIDNYGYASNYYGVTHPSDPNYYPIIGGSDFGFNYNCPSNCFPTGTPNLADNIEAAGKSWAGYAEGGGGYSTPTDRLPFLAFSDIFNDPQRVATHLFDISALGQGLTNPDTAPNFVWFAADDGTNMEGPTDLPFGVLNWLLGFLNPAHQYNVKAGDDWLQGPLTTIFNSPTWQDVDEKSAIFVTFDEDYNNLTTGVGNEGNHIVTVAIPSLGAVAGGMRAGGFVADVHYNHYSLLRTIEAALGLSALTNNDAYAQPMNEFWA